MNIHMHIPYIQCGVLSATRQQHSPLLNASASTALEEAFVVVGGRDHASAGGRRGQAIGDGGGAGDM